MTRLAVVAEHRIHVSAEPLGGAAERDINTIYLDVWAGVELLVPRREQGD
jgi:hypothetical protein